ncbi:hypothetical protein [Streptomyces sp. DSM 40907]|uniref:hypothetical protein n=1 Tax=Streptomyces kutzneri TaxID=3051179 RepID=UPI0028D2FED7|nr:hypothetical protein [Streptomyces sp. DSM 40907]
MDPASRLPETLESLETLIRQQSLNRSELLDPQELAVRTALPEEAVRILLQGGEPPADTVNERVRARISSLADAHLARTGERMSDLAGRISRLLGVSGFWARQVCTGEKTPSVDFLHGLVGFFGVDGGEAFFTVPASEALNRALLPVLASLTPAPEGAHAAVTPPAGVRSGHDDVRGIALRQARDLPEERWHVLNATLNALLELDKHEGDQ